MQTSSYSLKRAPLIAGLSALLLLAPGAEIVSAVDPKTFSTPNAAMAALIAAVRSRSTEQVNAILGPELETYISSRDKAQDEIDRMQFLDGVRRLKLEKQEDDPNTVIAYLGAIEWPFPAPLVKTPVGWKFDGKAATL